MNEDLPGASEYDYHKHVYFYTASYGCDHGYPAVNHDLDDTCSHGVVWDRNYHNGVPHRHNLTNDTINYGIPILDVASPR